MTRSIQRTRCFFPSFPRKRESMETARRSLWIPACAGMTVRGKRSKSSCRVQPREAGVEIGDEIVDILEPGMEAQARAAFPRRCAAQLLGMGRQHEALETAPTRAHA